MSSKICCRLCILAWALGQITALVADERTITREQADRIITELSQIRALLTTLTDARSPYAFRGQVTPDIKIGLGSAEVLGDSSAPLTIVEFTDYECPFCNRFYTETFETIKHLYIDAGSVRFVHKDLPLDVHKHALLAAQAAHCAGEQHAFWQMRERLSATPKELERADLVRVAGELGLNETRLDECLAARTYIDLINLDIKEAIRIGVSGTPALIIGKSTADGVVGQLMIGAVPLKVVEERIQSLLR